MSEKILPNRITQTVYLQDKEEPHGYRFVMQNKDGKYWCKYKGINTGLHPEPMLAAFVLHKLATAKGIDLSDPTLGKLEPYPESLIRVAHVDYDAIEYLRASAYRSGFVGVQRLLLRGKSRFAFKAFYRGVAYCSEWYDTPAEAAWAFHTQRNLRVGIIRDYEEIWNELKPYNPFTDESKLAPLATDSWKHGYKWVFQRPRQSTWYGSIAVDGVCNVNTPFYDTPLEAAWAVLHLQKHVAQVTWDDLKCKERNLAMLRDLRQNRNQVLLELKLEPVFVDFSKE